MTVRAELAITDCRGATMAEGGATRGGGYGLVDDMTILIDGGLIRWAGPRADAPRWDAERIERLDGRLVTPGLIDCHTHLVFGGERSGEYERRLEGATYADIARAGGGIAATVRATDALDEAGLVAAARPRLDALLRDGVTTVEIKSGYAGDAAGELRMLRAARALGAEGRVRVRTSFLGLHALPPAFAGRADDWVTEVIDAILPAVVAEGLADAVDAYVEPIAFSPEQAARFFAAAAKHGLPSRVHADQLSAGGGTALAARVRALSADHVEYASAGDVAALAAAGTVAVLLPGAFLTLRETTAPPVAALRAAGVPMAVATDCNPGTSPMASPLLAMNLACTLFGLTPAEALAGTTRNAARALGLGERTGRIASGLSADLATWDVSGPAELSYWLGLGRLHRRWLRGREV